MRRIPCRSKTLRSSRSVAATPARRLRVRSSLTSASGRLSSARLRLSAAESKSLAKPVTAYFEASSRSRWARRRTFSVSARARNSRSFCSASSTSSSVRRSSAERSSVSDSMGAPTRPSKLLLAASSGVDLFSSPFVVSCMVLLSNKTPNQLGGVVHHRDDPGVVDPGGADDPDRADDLLAAILVWGDHHRAAGHPEKAVLGADKNLYALPLFARIEQAQHGFPGFEHLEEGTQPFEIGEGGHILEEVGLTPHNQGATLVPARPARETCGNELRRQCVKLRLVRSDFLLDLLLCLLDGPADQPGIEVIAGGDQCCRRQAMRYLDD